MNKVQQEEIKFLLTQESEEYYKNVREQLPAEAATFAPKVVRRFILSSKGFESYLVTDVQLPLFTKKYFSKDLKCVNSDLNPFQVSFFSPISPSIIQQLTEWIRNNKKYDIVLQDLDQVGKVISQMTFKKCKVKCFRVSSLSYASNDLEKVTAQFDCKSVSIDF
jgi:hypothetical protein